MDVVRRIIMLIFFAFILLFVFGCQKYNDDNYLEFYHFINKAELLIIDEKYNEAHNIYKKAFKIWNEAPSIDYYNALLCVIKLNEEKYIENYLEILAKKGWEMEFFLKNPFLKKYRNSIGWKEFEIKYSKFHQSYLQSLDILLIASLDSMLKKDQELVKSKFYNEYLKTVITNANIIYKLIKQNKTDGLISSSVYSQFYSPFHVVILRHYGGLYNEVKKGYQDVDYLLNDTLKMVNLEKALIKEVKKGHLSPLVFELAVTYNGDLNKYGGQLFFKVGETILKKNLSKKRIEEINANRRSIGLENIEDYMKKLSFINNLEVPELKPYFFNFRIKERFDFMSGSEKVLNQFIENRLNEGWEKVSF